MKKTGFKKEIGIKIHKLKYPIKMRKNRLKYIPLVN
jgi:hypothetical protein